VDVDTQPRVQITVREPDPTEGPDFEAEATHVLQRLRTTLAEVVAGVPGHVSKPAELRRALNIDMNLGCKVFKVISASGSLAAGPHVPGLSALRTFLTAARRAGVSEPAVAAATRAAADFDRLVTSHAGDRTAFDSMISSLAGAGDAAQITLQQRRAVYRGQRHIFGAYAKVQLECSLIQPADEPGMIDFARISGLLSARRLRPDAPLIVARACITNDDGTVRAIRRTPLDPTADPMQELALLGEFCSQPLPQFRAVQSGPGRVYGELASNGLGKKAAITCVEGHVARAAVPRYRDEENRICANIAKIRTPCEVLILDLLVREDTFGALTPTAFACAEHLGEVAAPGTCAEWLRLEPRESVVYLGKGPSVLYAADIPRYAELGRHAFECLGWDGERFDVYRCRVEYPVLPSTVVMRFDLPAAPGTPAGSAPAA
jgi:hypothetical protein